MFADDVFPWGENKLQDYYDAELNWAEELKTKRPSTHNIQNLNFDIILAIYKHQTMTTMLMSNRVLINCFLQFFKF